jgi:hypothetical protein
VPVEADPPGAVRDRGVERAGSTVHEPGLSSELVSERGGEREEAARRAAGWACWLGRGDSSG